MALKPAELEWLKQCATSVARSLHKRLPPDIWRKPRLVPLYDTSNSGGFVAQLGALRGDVGSQLQIWIDQWSDGKTWRVAYGYRSTRPERVRDFSSTSYGKLRVVNTKRTQRLVHPHDARSRMHPALRHSEAGRPLLEVSPIPGEWSFVSVYEWSSPSVRRAPSVSLVNRAAAFLEWVARAAAYQPEKAYAAMENRRRVAMHLKRERSSKLAKARKHKDGFTCCVCGNNLEDVYGPYGMGIADAHHIKSLAQAAKPQITRLDDLITVCPNCHRVLHQMSGTPKDWRKLRKLYLSRNRRA